MGIIKAVTGAVGGALADQWLEVIEADEMGDGIVFTSGRTVRQDDSRNQNKKGTDLTITNGSKIHVYPNQFMMLLDGGKIVDYTAEPGYYTVDNSSLPSLFNGEFGDTLKESFSRIKFGGVTPTSQRVFFVNLQEIKGIKFGTRNPVNYFDNFYNSELFLRAHGSYSIKVTDPVLFFEQVIPRNAERVNINDINEQYIAEFLDAFQSALNQFSADGQRISFVTSKSRELSKYMQEILDDEWRLNRGMEVQAVGVASISYDEESQKLINMRNQGAMLSDPTVREGYVQGAVARGMEAAGSNAGGSMAGFMGMGIGMQAGGGFMGAASQSNQMQMQQQQQQQPQQPVAQQQSQSPATTPVSGWACGCGVNNTGKFCIECGKPQPVSNNWLCECGTTVAGKFCTECGKPKPPKGYRCNKCGYTPAVGAALPKFCPECGDPMNEEDAIN